MMLVEQDWTGLEGSKKTTTNQEKKKKGEGGEALERIGGGNWVAGLGGRRKEGVIE